MILLFGDMLLSWLGGAASADSSNNNNSNYQSGVPQTATRITRREQALQFVIKLFQLHAHYWLPSSNSSSSNNSKYARAKRLLESAWMSCMSGSGDSDSSSSGSSLALKAKALSLLPYLLQVNTQLVSWVNFGKATFCSYCSLYCCSCIASNTLFKFIGETLAERDGY